jgi:hypothetical protein
VRARIAEFDTLHHEFARAKSRRHASSASAAWIARNAQSNAEMQRPVDRAASSIGGRGATETCFNAERHVLLRSKIDENVETLCESN